MKRAIPILLLLALAGGLGAWWFDMPGRLRGGADGEAGLTLYGNVDIRQVELGFRVAGRIATMTYEEGDSVELGAILAALERRPYEDSLRAARAEVARQEANVEKMQAGTRPAEIAQARALVTEREATLARTEQNLARRSTLIRTGASTQAALDEAQAERDEAAARLASSRRALDQAQEGFRTEDIAAARAALEGAKAALAAAETSLADTELHAPAGGVILARSREPGAIVAPSDVVYTLSLTRPVWVRAYVAEPQLGRIHPGMAVDVRSDTRPQAPYRGQIGFISPVAEFTPKSVETAELRTDLVYRLRIVVDAPDDGLRQGMPVTITVPPPGHELRS
jgi:HlyD family secretion protein